jgi:hypothetical protein
MKRLQNRLLYRRQFILGPKYIKFAGWKREKISNNLFLTVHPDLEATKVRSRNNFIVLLGYILDPYNPSFNNLQIIKKIMDNAITADDIFDQVSSKGGRFVIIAKINNDFRIFNDAAGLRQIFYCKDSSNHLWCASQPTIIAEQLNLKVNESIKKELFSTPLFSMPAIYYYPGSITLFNGISHLMPNHYLDFSTGACVRYWPIKRLNSFSVKKSLEISSTILCGLFEAACNRFNLALSMSAGYDSRLLLAASRNVKEKVYYFSHTRGTNDYDVTIPAALLPRLKLKHHIIINSGKMEKKFKALLQRNVLTARMPQGSNAYAIHEHFKNENKEWIIVQGIVSEIARRDLTSKPRWPDFAIHGWTLAMLAKMYNSKLVVKEFSKWLQEAKKAKQFGVDILDLYLWEYAESGPSAMACSEYDIAFECFSPYNCRQLLENAVSLNIKYRIPPDYKFHVRLIKNLWPEVLELRINPPKNKMNIAKNFLYRTGLFDVLKYFYFVFERIGWRKNEHNA